MLKKAPDILVSRPKEEVSKIPTPTEDKMRAAIEKGMRLRQSFEAVAAPAPAKSRIRYS